MIRKEPDKRPKGMTKHDYNLRQAGIAKREAIRHEALMSRMRAERMDPQPRKQSPVLFKRIFPFLICIIVLIFFFPSRKSTALIRTKPAGEPLLQQLLDSPEIPNGIIRVAAAAKNYIIFFQDTVAYSDILSGVYEDTLLISAESKPITTPKAPIIYELAAQDLAGIELFINEENHPFDAVYASSPDGKSLLKGAYQ